MLFARDDAVHDMAIGWRIVVAVASIVIVGFGSSVALHVKKRVQLAPAIEAVGVARLKTAAERNSALIEEEVDIGGGRAGEVGSVRAERVRSCDDFNVEAGAKGREVRGDERVWAWVVVGGQEGGELGEGEGRENGLYVCVVGKVKVERLVEGKGLLGRVEGCVDLRARVAQRVILEPCNDFLYVAEANSTPCWRLEAREAGEEEIIGVLEILPLGVCEQRAEITVAKGNLARRISRGKTE